MDRGSRGARTHRRRRGYHHGDLRRALIETAISMINEAGTESVTMRTLSDRVGVSRSAPYRHFPDKTALLCAIAEEGFRELEGRLEEAARDTSLGALARFEQTAIAYVDFAVSNAAHYRLMFSDMILTDPPNAGLRAAAEGAFGVALRAIRACQEEGSIGAGDAVVLANISWATVHGLSVLILDRQLMATDQRGGLHALLGTSEGHGRRGGHQRFVADAVGTLIRGMKASTGDTNEHTNT